MFTTAPASTARPAAPPPEAIIADRAEFVETLRALQRGHVLVKAGEGAGSVLIDGRPVYHSYPPLLRYGLVHEFRNPRGFEKVRYYRLTPEGRAFADKAWASWRSRPLWQRLAVRFTG